EGHLLADGKVNSAPATFIIDTGSPVSALDRSFCESRRIAVSRQTFSSRGIHFTDTGAGVTSVDDMRIGSYKIRGEPVAVFDISRLLQAGKQSPKAAGLLGAHTLEANLAVIDCENLKLYLRAPK